MAQTENGIGISWKLPDQTMIWARRDTWAELAEDVRIIKGDDYLKNLEAVLHGADQIQQEPAEPLLTPEQAQAQLSGVAAPQQLPASGIVPCPRCGALKNKLVPKGFSQKTQKPYPAFYACPTQGCPGR